MIHYTRVKYDTPLSVGNKLSLAVKARIMFSFLTKETLTSQLFKDPENPLHIKGIEMNYSCMF